MNDEVLDMISFLRHCFWMNRGEQVHFCNLHGISNNKPIMMEFSPRDFRTNLYDKHRVATYFYRVTQDVVAIKDKEVVNSYHHVEDFKDADLRKARQEAVGYLTERFMTLPEGFIFPYLSPEEHAANPDKEFSAYSHSVLLIEYSNDDILEEWPVAGEDEDDVREGLEHETEVWLSKGLGKPPDILPVL